MRVPRKRARAAQRDDNGSLIYSIGEIGGSGEVCGDLSASKAPKNKAEGECFEQLSASGWKLTKRGWPDFFCVKDGEIMAVEVKPHKGSLLKRDQVVVMGLLAERGIPCYLWTPDGGLERMTGLK